MADAADDEGLEELETLTSIFPELTRDLEHAFDAKLELAVTPSEPFVVRFVSEKAEEAKVISITFAGVAAAQANAVAHVEQQVQLSHLPPLCLDITLPPEYPADAPPRVRLSTRDNWLPQEKLAELEHDAERLWEEYGRSIILYAYIDHLQQAAERGFDRDQSAAGCLILPEAQKSGLVAFDEDTKLAVFNAGTYECGICLEPKKGRSCYRMKRCGHVYCRECLQGFYNNAITEGDIAGVRCLDPTCGKETRVVKRKKERNLSLRELLAMGIEESMVRRYVEMKRKKKLEADKTIVYCPRSWCQGAARSAKYAPIPLDITQYAAYDSSGESDTDSTSPAPSRVEVPPDPSDRLAVCEKCNMAFCKVCYMGWHGPFARCFPRDPNELSAEDKASYDYIRLNTSPCPTCNSPTSKTHGCNHMVCFQCNTHFCYLCSSWLDSGNPYQHFNKFGSECYQRLWELEEGDEGQGPEDGRGFGGGRQWERAAIEAAREADEQEAAEAAAAAAEVLDAPPRAVPIVVDGLARLDLAHEEEAPRPGQRRGGRRQRNPFPAHPPGANGAAQAVRNYERNARGRGGGGGGGGGAANGNARQRWRPALQQDEEERQQQELQRFLELAQRDEEDGWDSDELGDEEGFRIR